MAATDIEIVKLQGAGSKLFMDVESAALLSIGQYPEVEFVGRDEMGRQVALRVPQKSADRQLGRIPLTYAECAGVSLLFSRDANASDASKPYWGISLGQRKAKGTAAAKPSGGSGGGAGAAQGGERPASSATPAIPLPDVSGIERIFQLHDVCVDHAVKVTAKKLGDMASPEAVMAAANTLFIQASRHGSH